jgi:hypothetical protein
MLDSEKAKGKAQNLLDQARVIPDNLVKVVLELKGVDV